MVTVQAVLCDIDGVIRHWHEDRFDAVEREHNVPAGTLGEVAFARDVLYPACVGEITAREWLQRTAQRLHERGLPEPSATALVGALGSNTFTIDHEVLDWLATVRRQLPVWLFTNQTDDCVDRLRGTGVLEQVDGLVNSAEIGAIKPEPRAYRIAAERVGVALEHCLFIDDRVENIEAAAQLGMATVLYRTIADLDGVLNHPAG